MPSLQFVWWKQILFNAEGNPLFIYLLLLIKHAFLRIGWKKIFCFYSWREKQFSITLIKWIIPLIISIWLKTNQTLKSKHLRLNLLHNWLAKNAKWQWCQSPCNLWQMTSPGSTLSQSESAITCVPPGTALYLRYDFNVWLIVEYLLSKILYTFLHQF